ncbi:MAG: hypothetical protein V1930_09710 [Pseudomonadota bacterium]
MKSYSLLIEHQCPQCGAPAILEETDHLFTCEFCRVKSYLMSGVFRYRLPHSAPKDKELIYFPYWRFKGMLFACVSNGIKNRIVDVSYRAIESANFPISVGIRSQTLKLRFVDPDAEGRFLEPRVTFQEMVQIIENRFSLSLPKPIFYQSFIGETFSHIYSPFYVDRGLYDAILNMPVTPGRRDDLDLSGFQGDRPKWRIQFVTAQCPDCGWDLNGERDSLVLDCGNCHSMWQPNKGRFMKLPFGHIPVKETQIIYLPFWRIKAETSGIELDSYADLIRVANLPRVVKEEDGEKPFHFWSPAFKVRPDDFLRSCRNPTLFQFRGELLPDLPAMRRYPVTLSIMEAMKSLKLNLASFIKPQKTFFPKLREIDIRPKSFTLVYIPFRERGDELAQPQFRLIINKNTLKFAHFL